MANNSAKAVLYVRGDLVQYVEYFYFPSRPYFNPTGLQNNDIGIVIETVHTMYGNELYDVYWLRTGTRNYTAAMNLKLAYLVDSA